MKCFFTHKCIQSQAGTDSKNPRLLTAFPAYLPQIYPVKCFTSLILSDTGTDFPQALLRCFRQFQISAKIIPLTSGDHAKTYLIKVSNTIQDFIDRTVSPNHQQIDRLFTLHP